VLRATAVGAALREMEMPRRVGRSWA